MSMQRESANPNRRPRWAALLALLLAIPSVVATAQEKEEPADEYRAPSIFLGTQADSLGYIIGYRFGEALEAQNAGINRPIVRAGLEDALGFGVGALNMGAVNLILYRVRQREQQLTAIGDTAGDLGKKLFGIVSKNDASKISTWNDSVSYAIGHQYGSTVRQRGMSVTGKRAGDGMRDQGSGIASAISEQGELSLNVSLQLQKNVEELDKLARIEREMAMLQELSETDGYITMPSGIVYEVLEQGDGATPKGHETVILHFVSSFVGEEPFLDTRVTNQPVEVAMRTADPSWIPILSKMPVGSRYRMFLPPEVGFKAAPKELERRVLIYEMELVEIASEGSDSSDI